MTGEKNNIHVNNKPLLRFRKLDLLTTRITATRELREPLLQLPAQLSARTALRRGSRIRILTSQPVMSGTRSFRVHSSLCSHLTV